MTEAEIAIFKEWDLILRNISDFVQLDKVKGIKFEIRTKEKGHNTPHLHVITEKAQMSVAIENGEILECSGRISNPQKNMAREWVLNRHDLLVEKWNELSNGIKIAV